MTEVVVELSGNHGSVLANAKLLIVQAKNAGADAVKLQCFDPERLAIRRAKNPAARAIAESKPEWSGIPLVDLYQQTHTPREWFPSLIAVANMTGIPWFSSVFDPDDVAFLETLGCPRYKISAFEMLDWDIIKAVRETGKPIVMSMRASPGVTLLMASDYEGHIPPFGLSAHAALKPWHGAPMVEYHLKLDGVETPDSAFSLTMEELREITTNVRRAASKGAAAL